MTRRVAVAVAAAAGLLAGHGGARAASCPPPPLPLAAPPTAAERAGAAAAALRFVRTTYAPTRILVTDRMFVAHVRWPPRWPGDAFVASSCGAAVAWRTLAVSVVFPAMYADPTPDTSGCTFCGGATFLVSRTGRGWRVWYVL